MILNFGEESICFCNDFQNLIGFYKKKYYFDEHLKIYDGRLHLLV